MANRREFTASSLAGKVERKVNAKTVKEMYEKLLFLYFPVTAFIWADSFYQPHVPEIFQVFLNGGIRYFQLLCKHFSCYRRLNYDGIKYGCGSLSEFNSAVFSNGFLGYFYDIFLGTFEDFLGTFGGLSERECQGGSFDVTDVFFDYRVFVACG